MLLASTAPASSKCHANAAESQGLTAVTKSVNESRDAVLSDVPANLAAPTPNLWNPENEVHSALSEVSRVRSN